jgi:hypothetical protein
MTQALPDSPAVDAPIAPGTLRADIEARRARGETYSLREVVAIIVPICTEVVDRHNKGEKFTLTPSTISFELGRPNRLIKSGDLFATRHPHDRACSSPEFRSSKGEKGGDIRSSVFSVGAIMYEMLTGQSVGPGMRRPRDLRPDLPASIEAVLGKALIGDPAHRPGDLGALAQAIHHLAPTASQAPPPADESALDSGADLEIDVRLSLMPPASPDTGPSLPKPGGLPRDLMPPAALSDDGGLVEVAHAPAAPPPVDATAHLADLKSRLEADPRARYVVIKEEMDHGPFTAIELLQQIASHTFEAHHFLKDSFSGDERQIKDWEEFAPFAVQSKLNRQIVAEKKEIERVVIAEGKATRSKALIIGAAIAGICTIGGLVFVSVRQFQRTEIEVQGDQAISIETDAGIKGETKKVPGGGAWAGSGSPAGGGNYPVLRGGMSCEEAMNTYVTELKMAGNKPDISAGAYGSSLNSGGYVIACGAPMSMTVNICAAIQNGRAVGVTVTTDPPNPGIASCISGRIRGMGFPSGGALDVTRTVFKGQ